MKKISDIIFLVIISFICLFLFFCFLFHKKEEFSEVENRYLETFSWNHIQEYVNDHFPFRNEFISFKNHLELGLGKTSIQNISIGKDDYLLPEFRSSNDKDTIIEVINRFTENHSNVDIMIVPDSICINHDKVKNQLGYREEDDISYLYSKINANSISLIPTFLEENKKKPLYYKTDHHWNHYGAYVAYRKYFQDKNWNYYDLSQFNKKKLSSNFLGTSSYQVLGVGREEDMFLYDKDSFLDVEYVYEKKKTDTLYQEEHLSKKDKYAYFLDGNHALMRIHNFTSTDHKSIIVIKNSYGNSFVPYLVNHFKDTYVVDLRYYHGTVSEIISENNISNILILYNLNNLYSDMSIVSLK